MQLTFKLIDNSSQTGKQTLEVHPSLTISSVKAQLSQIIGHDASLIRIVLIREGTEMLCSDESSLESLEITENSTLFLDWSSSEVEQESVIREQLRSKRDMGEQKVPAPGKDWLSLLVQKIQAGVLSGVLQMIADYEREESGKIVDDEEDLFSVSDSQGYTALHYACQAGHANMVQQFVAKHGACNRESQDNFTPLMLAVHHGHLECVRAILKHPRIQINKMTYGKGTALHIACRKGFSNIVQLLLENGAEMTVEDQLGLIPLQVASTQEIFEIIPKFMGERELKSIQEGLPKGALNFSSDVYYTGSLVIEDKLVFLYIDHDKGLLKCFEDKESFIQGQEPWLSTNIIDIWDIKTTKGILYGDKNAMCFILYSKLGNYKFYTNQPDLTNEWVNRLQAGINYCQIHKRGYIEQDLKTDEANLLLKQELTLRSTFKKTEEVNFKSFTILGELGSGSFGKVYKVIKNDTKQVFAIKQLNKQFLINQKQLKYAIGECKILRYLRHPFIISMTFAFQTPKNLYMVLELCPNGDLMTHLSERSRFAESVARFYIAETVLAVEYLHSLDIVYRDLKPENILLDRAGHIRLADFGLAKENVNPLNPAMSFCGSPAYLAPEMLSKTGSEKSADVYGIGAILYELLTGLPPFYSDNIKELFRNIKSGMLQFPKTVKPEAQDLMRKLMNKDPSKRPSISQVKHHVFFRDINWEELEKKKVKAPRLGNKWMQVDENWDEPSEELPVVNNSKKIVDDDDYEEEELDDSVAEFNFSRN
jgi:serine/threonine protein kinase